ncbi:mitochondrial fission process protein 1-like [Limulus polyphemus]|uniref:Mitochondrial fission process protein 1 n=1 Tax=Limulus polyphemus TaxID=6850 RepID=A0ABM1TSN9_LIMPO|nr:mitochondrial fission process protein 1-like [Limulus polyphemus]XP_022258892.1 mitochondrial fission process protein 1-like [Limulus polyphemus]XP_022258893.1 mitochondrial fission process protein 1-like [Limulus polyphemus]XP_022258894.1 mitochondrial fission process protein 1-like [Limulus polyphemus]XP_022258895.1 mitochondrial fission process protein 1-like [Limulus polyphemus]
MADPPTHLTKSDKHKNAVKTEEETDIFRDTPIRLLGYANEVGESFRALVPVSVVHFSYVVASCYVLADTADKVIKEKQVQSTSKEMQHKKLFHVASDTLIWQSLASVIIPGFTINRVCATSLFFLRKMTSLPPATRKWTTTALGLGCIPFIVKPIDNFVDYLMDKTFRHWIKISEN